MGISYINVFMIPNFCIMTDTLMYILSVKIVFAIEDLLIYLWESSMASEMLAVIFYVKKLTRTLASYYIQ